MKRRDFLKTTAIGAALGMTGYMSSKASNISPDITYNTLPRWRGFNLLEKFTHKPDEWLSVAPEWGYKNDPFKESDFALISELGFSYVRLPMSYKCWCEEDDWYKLKEKHLKGGAPAPGILNMILDLFNIIFFPKGWALILYW